MSIVVENLSKLYGEQKAIDNLNFSVEKGEILGFLGPNGAGKTTTMKILTCFLPQSSGKAFINGMDVSKESKPIKRLIGYLPEHNPLYHDMYIKEYLHWVAKLHKIPNRKNRIEELITLIGLEREQKKKIGSLSKGYKQRVGLAQAIIHDPEVLILDEPTSGLDPNQLVEIRKLIKNIGQDKTVIFSSHIMQEVEALCSRVIILDKGQLIADDPISRLAGRVSERKQLKVQFEQPVSAENWKKISEIIEVKSDTNSQYILYSKIEDDIRKKVFKLAVDMNNPILGMHQDDASVEEVFQLLTQNDSGKA